MKAAQGTKYRHGQDEVIALEHSDYPRVIKIQADPTGYIWTGFPYNVDARELEPMPLKYLMGEMPS